MAKTSTEQYRTNPESRRKHVRDNSPGGKYAHSKKYKREHAAARDSLKIARGSKLDASKQADGTYKAESRRTNRGRGGRLRR